MDAHEFDARLKTLNMTRPEFARLVGIDPGTAGGWGKTRNGRPSHVPSWVPFALAALATQPINENAGPTPP